MLEARGHPFQAASKLLSCMGYTPPALVRRMLYGGATTDRVSTHSDIATASSVYGRLVPELLGKAVQRKELDILTVEPGKLVGPLELTMHTDIL